MKRLGLSGSVLVLLAVASCAAQTEVRQRRFGTMLVGAAVSSGGEVSARLRCGREDEFQLLLGKVLELRDRVVLNPGGLLFMSAFGVEPSATWGGAQMRGGEELSRCLRLLLEKMPSFLWADLNLAVTRIGMAEAALAERTPHAEEAKVRERQVKRTFDEFLSSAATRLGRILKQRPGNIVARLLMAEIIALSGRWDDAAARLGELELRGVESSHLHAWLGFIAHQQKKNVEAIERFRRAIHADTDDDALAYARYALGFLDGGAPQPERRGSREEPLQLLYPPFLRAELPRRPTEITHFLLRAAVLDFVDQTHLAGDLHRVLADRLTTELRRTERFELYDRGQLRDQPRERHAEIVKRLKKQVDLVISGAITKLDFKSRRAEVDLRVVSTHDDLVLFAKRYTVKILAPQRRIAEHKHEDSKVSYELSATDLFGLDDASLTQIGNEVQEALPRVGDGRVTELAPSFVVVDKGLNDRVFRGMSAYVEAVMEDLVDPKAPSGLVSTGLFVGQLYVVSVQPTKSLAVCVRSDGQRCALRVGDVVRFK